MNEIDVSECEFYQDNNGIEIQSCYERTDICELEDAKETGKSCCDVKDCYFKQLQELKKENEQLKEDWYNSTKCHHLVLDECSLTGKTCKCLQECFKQAEKKLERIKTICEHCKEYCFPEEDEEMIIQDILQIIQGEKNAR